MRRLLRLPAALLLGLGAWLAVPAPVAAVDSPTIDDVGWWGRLNQQALPTGGLLYNDVTTGQLLVEGTPEGATAIAAVRATLPEGTGDPVLTLQASSAAGAETAVLLACQAGSGWTGAHAGAWDAKPSPDCSASVQGVPAEDGSSFTFALAPLQFGDQIDVVLTPGVLAEGQGSSTFRVVFERPGPEALVVSEAASPPPAFPAPSFGGSDTEVPVTPASPSFAPSAPSSFSVPTPPTPSQLASQPAQAALPPTEQGATATAPRLAPQPLAAPPVEVAGTEGRALGALVVLAAGGLLLWTSQQPVPDRQVLSRFATAAVGTGSVAAAPEPTLGGLGRFRRERSGPARRIG
ncbi:MAG: hypothetical protein ACLGIC_12445 [Acidimicrobiia bacterium]